MKSPSYNKFVFPLIYIFHIHNIAVFRLCFNKKQGILPPKNRAKIAQKTGKTWQFTPLKTGKQGISREIWPSEARKRAKRVLREKRVERVKYSWGSGGRCKPPSGVQGRSPGNFLIFHPKISHLDTIWAVFNSFICLSHTKSPCRLNFD